MIIGPVGTLMYKGVTVAEMRKLISYLPDDWILAPNQNTENLGILEGRIEGDDNVMLVHGVVDIAFDRLDFFGTPPDEVDWDRVVADGRDKG